MAMVTFGMLELCRAIINSTWDFNNEQFIASSVNIYEYELMCWTWIKEETSVLLIKAHTKILLAMTGLQDKFSDTRPEINMPVYLQRLYSNCTIHVDYMFMHTVHFSTVKSLLWKKALGLRRCKQ